MWLIWSLFLAATVVAQRCPIQFDGRIPSTSQLSVLDTSASPFNPSNVFGKGLKWSEIIEFPNNLSYTQPSLFDVNHTKSFTMTINDSSIFAPSDTNIQTGFRRAEFLPMSNNGSDASTVGIKTLHFSLKSDVSRPLNYSHEYQLVFLETADYSSNQFALKTGTILESKGPDDPRTLTLYGNVNSVPLQVLFGTPFTEGEWHNYGLLLDFDKLTTQVFYSKGCHEPLANVTEPLSNNVAGQGQYHFGMLKKPTGNNLTDLTKQGFQESGIEEAIIYGGIFQEDSSAGCISLKA